MPALAVNTVNPTTPTSTTLASGCSERTHYARCAATVILGHGASNLPCDEVNARKVARYTDRANYRRSPLIGLISALAIRMPAFARTFGSWARKRPLIAASLDFAQ